MASGTVDIAFTLTNGPLETSSGIALLDFTANNFSFDVIDAGLTSILFSDANGRNLPYKLISPTVSTPGGSCFAALVQTNSLAGGGGTVTNGLTMTYSSTATTSPSTNAVFTEPACLFPTTSLIAWVPNSASTAGETDSLGNSFSFVQTAGTVARTGACGVLPGGISVVPELGSISLYAPGTLAAIDGNGNPQTVTQATPFTGNALQLDATGTLTYVKSVNSITINPFLPLSLHLDFTTPVIVTGNQGILDFGSTGQQPISMSNGTLSVGVTSTGVILAASTHYVLDVISNNHSMMVYINGSSEFQTGNQADIWFPTSGDIYIGISTVSGIPVSSCGITINALLVEQVSWTPSDVVNLYTCLNIPKWEASRKLVKTQFAAGGLPPWITTTGNTGMEPVIVGFNGSDMPNMTVNGVGVSTARGLCVFDAYNTAGTPQGGYMVFTSAPSVATSSNGGVIFANTPIAGGGSLGIAGSVSGSAMYFDGTNYNYGFSSPAYSGSSTNHWCTQTSWPPLAPTLHSPPGLSTAAISYYLSPAGGTFNLVQGSGSGFSTQLKRSPNLTNGGSWTLVGSVTLRTANDGEYGAYSGMSGPDGTLHTAYQNNSSINEMTFCGASNRLLQVQPCYNYNSLYNVVGISGAPVVEYTSSQLEGPASAVIATSIGNYAPYYDPDPGGNGETGILYQGGANATQTATFMVVASYQGTPAQLLTDGEFNYAVGTEYSPPTNSGAVITIKTSPSMISGVAIGARGGISI